MDDMVDYAREHDVDLVVFAGDAFKTRTPTPTYLREFAHRIRDLAALAHHLPGLLQRVMQVPGRAAKRGKIPQDSEIIVRQLGGDTS